MIDILKTYENGGKIEVYQMVNRLAVDYDKIYSCCEYFAEQGNNVIITPFFKKTVGIPLSEQIYASLKDTPFWGKCPDFKVNNIWYEHEGFDKTKDLDDPQKKSDKFCLMMKRGIKQSDRIVVEDTGIGRSWARRIIYNRVWFEKQNISEVYIRTDNGLELLFKK